MEKNCMSDDEMMAKKRQFAKEYYGDRVSPDYIRELEPNEVFVFGSNADGHHRLGAAKYAMDNFGAIWGQSEGLQGQSYAIPTTEGYDNLAKAVVRFTEFAGTHPDQRFLVTPVGCGFAGYSVDQIAPLFKGCIQMENVALPREFWTILGLSMMK